MTDPDPLAVAAMAARCGWDPSVAVSNAVALLDGNDAGVLMLPCLNVTAVTVVTVTDAWGNTSSPTIGPGMCVGWSANGVLTWNGSTTFGEAWSQYGAWPLGQGNISVTYSGGYNPIPDDLEAALLHLSARLPSMGMTGTKMGTGSATFGQQIGTGDLLMIESMVFDKYRIPRVA